MTFQGDVGGIGLADLLQSLARGRDGILTLGGRSGTQSTLGIQDGLLHFLPDPNEDSETWRARARTAWALDPDFRIDSLRMNEIARAQRIGNLYDLLDSDSVHFRFAPGPLPEAPSDSGLAQAEPGLPRSGVRRDAVFCAPMAIDGFLLEYARLKDEIHSLGADAFVSPHTVLRTIEGMAASPELQRFAAECDGNSSLCEISDRLGWPLRQLGVVAATEILRGTLHAAGPEELLDLAQKELLANNSARAASRLCAWCECAWPGPLRPADADFLVHEWNAGRLSSAIRTMPKREARCLLRRLDHSADNAFASLERWKEFAGNGRGDAISNARLLVCQVRLDDANLPPIRDLIAAARGFLERRQRMRAAALLRVAAARQPETTAARLELGQCMLAADLCEEGAPWIVEACRVLVQEGQAEKALAPLRTLIERHPSNREARRLLARARARSMRRRMTGKNTLALAAAVVALAVVGWVRVDRSRDYERRINEVAARLSDPVEALRLLEQDFAGDESPRVLSLRISIEERRKAVQGVERSGWIESYRRAQVECSEGDPLLGLQRALEIPPAPQTNTDEAFPLVSDLFNTVAARGESALRELGEHVEDAPAQVHAEQRLEKLLDDLRTGLAGHERTEEVKEFEARLDDLAKRLDARGEQRGEARSERLRRDNLARQDLLLAAARAHAQAGDHARSLTVYRRLIESDDSGKLKDLLSKEIRQVEVRNAAVLRARELALSGKHPEAKKVLEGAFEHIGDYLLPWRVETFPHGARARFEDGTERVAPFSLESAFGEKVSMTIELAGYEPLVVRTEEPGDKLVYLSRKPERHWSTSGRVEALPLALGEDHVVCDRAGNLARLSRSGDVMWTKKLPSLGGIARTPAFLPRRAGSFVVVTEDGDAWIVDSSSGATEGPLALGSQPVDGPTPIGDGVRVRLRDGSTATWTSSLKPESARAGAAASPNHEDSPAGSGAQMTALRRSSLRGSSLASPWTELRVDVSEGVYTVRASGEDQPSFSVRREGEWSYVAWEAPTTLIPRGRLWVADGLGLRSFQP